MADTNIATYIEQIASNRDRLKVFIKDTLGGTPASPEQLTQLVDWFVGTGTTAAGFIIQGSPTATVTEGTSYTIQKGWYNGGTITGIAGGGNYTLQDKTVTPTKSTQTLNADQSYYGLGTVTVNAIPDAYQDVTGVTAAASDVLVGKKYVTSVGTLTTGTMTNNGAVNKTLDATTNNQSYTIPKGYHSGSGKVQIVLETKTATPTTTAQTITPTSGKVLSAVTVKAIPDNYADISDASEVNDDTARYLPSGTILYGKSTDSTSSAVTPSKITGTATKYTSKNIILDATSSEGSYTNTTANIEQGYHETGTVKVVVQDKTITSSNTLQTVTPDAGKVLGSVTVNAIGTGALATPTLDTTTGKVTAKISTGGYLAANTSTTLNLSTQAAKTITPSTIAQTAVDKNKYTLGAVTVAAIPSNYGNVSDATGTAADVLSGKIVYGKNSSTGAAIKLTGTMTNNGAGSITFDPMTQTSATISAGYYNGTGTVTLTNDLETALAAI